MLVFKTVVTPKEKEEKMRVSPILANNYAYSNKKSNLPALTSKPEMVNSQVSFTGLNLFSGFKTNKTVITTAEQVIENLKKRDSGLFIFDGKKYTEWSLNKFNKLKPGKATKYIVKYPIVKEDGGAYRPGIQPFSVGGALEKGIEEAIVVVDDGLHKLNLPKDKYLRKQAMMVYDDEIRMLIHFQLGLGYFIKPEGKTSALFSATQDMVKQAKIVGMSLEKVKG